MIQPNHGCNASDDRRTKSPSRTIRTEDSGIENCSRQSQSGYWERMRCDQQHHRSLWRSEDRL